jgi:hypothetical protein
MNQLRGAEGIFVVIAVGWFLGLTYNYTLTAFFGSMIILSVVFPADRMLFLIRWTMFVDSSTEFHENEFNFPGNSESHF